MLSRTPSLGQTLLFLLLVLSLTPAMALAAPKEVIMHKAFPMPPLEKHEADVILRKGTEAPYTGRYTTHHAAGTYLCRQCGAPLYRSTDKFDSNCGWPSFDDAIPNAVRRVPDADGRRVEILCNTCGGHLGHVFEGERFTAKDTRHCVNSLSMLFVPAGSDEEKAALAAAGKTAGTVAGKTADSSLPPAPASGNQTAIVAGGCFWGVEDAFRKLPGVLDAVSGYTGGHTKNPTYQDVCRGDTGHAEAVRVTFDPAKISYEQILRRFFEVHDPTELDRQGPDVGSQYRSAVFYLDADQKAVAEKLMGLLQDQGYKVVTELAPASTFYEAEAYHQRYAERTGRGGCHLPVPRFDRRAR